MRPALLKRFLAQTSSAPFTAIRFSRRVIIRGLL
ncbi:hypothetical protein PANA5342_3649 [Pantoea ananatis LMG 5342]|nr:hypothetical protein PANA5342_3649 [Pantoea ananatis LMG 5342]